MCGNGLDKFIMLKFCIGNITYVFGLIAWDTNGRSANGPLSNLVSASMVFREHAAREVQQVDPTGTDKQDESEDPSSAEDDNSENGNREQEGGREDETGNEDLYDGPSVVSTHESELSIEVILILSGCCTLTVACFLVLILLFMRHRRQLQRKLYQQEAQSYYPTYPNTTVSRGTSYPLRVPRYLSDTSSREYFWERLGGPSRESVEFPNDIGFDYI